MNTAAKTPAAVSARFMTAAVPDDIYNQNDFMLYSVRCTKKGMVI